MYIFFDSKRIDVFKNARFMKKSFNIYTYTYLIYLIHMLYFSFFILFLDLLDQMNKFCLV